MDVSKGLLKKHSYSCALVSWGSESVIHQCHYVTSPSPPNPDCLWIQLLFTFALWQRIYHTVGGPLHSIPVFLCFSSLCLSFFTWNPMRPCVHLHSADYFLHYFRSDLFLSPDILLPFPRPLTQGLWIIEMWVCAGCTLTPITPDNEQQVSSAFGRRLQLPAESIRHVNLLCPQIIL